MKSAAITLVLVLIFTLVEWKGRESNYALEKIDNNSKFMRWGLYYLLIAIMFVFGGTKQQFIYFQF